MDGEHVGAAVPATQNNYKHYGTSFRVKINDSCHAIRLKTALWSRPQNTEALNDSGLLLTTAICS